MFKGFWKIDKSLEESRFTQLIGLVLLICVGILHDLEILMRQLLGCADRGVYHIELIGRATMIQIYHALRPCLSIASLYSL